MSIMVDVTIPANRNRGQGMPVDFLVQFCIEEGIHDIGSMERLWKVTWVDKEGNETTESMSYPAIEQKRGELGVRLARKMKIAPTDQWEIDGN